MSFADEVRPWHPADFDPASASGGGTAVMAPPSVARPRPMATIAAASAAAGAAPAGWSPPAIEERRPAPPRPARGERERGYEQGYADGLAAGREQGEAHVLPALQALEQVVERLQAGEAEFVRERERNLTALALTVARKLVQQEIEIRPERLQALVNRALELVPPGVPSEVRMHPEDLEALLPGIEKLAVEGRGPAVQWIGDPGLSRGSFMVDSPTRIVDGRIDSALRQLYERLDHD